MEMRGKRGVAVVACALMAGLSAVAQARVMYVDDDANVPGDGSSWASAFTWLQHALAAAEAGDEIRVAHGSYRPDLGAHPESRPTRPPSDGLAVHIHWMSPYVAFQLKSGVALRGGFAGMAADDPNVRDERRYQTILSGDLNGNDQEILHLWGNPLWEFLRADNSLHVVESAGTDSTAVLEGFVIESAVESGLLNLAGSPSIANCIFRNNSALYADGGGLRCEGGRLILSNCVFERNLSGSGGAVYAAGTDLTLADCHFSGNWATLGGAICGIDADLALSRCTFELNGASQGGAIHQTGGALTLVECTLEANVAERSGGAVTFAAETVAMTRCLFVGNRATGWAAISETGLGGALKNEGTPLTLDECTFSGNAAVEGGAVYALRLTEPRMAAGPGTTMTHCLLTGNRAQRAGGALYSDHVEFTILGCTFAGNWAPTAGTLAWRPGLTFGTTVWQLGLDHCIAWDSGESIGPSRRGQPQVGSWEEPEVVIRYSNVQGGWPGEGNIDADPCFAAPGCWVNAADLNTIVDPSHPNGFHVGGDYHLKSQVGRWDPNSETWVLDDITSPCIDAGDPNSPVGDEPEPNGSRINMGAYGGTAEASRSYVQEP